MNKYALLLLSAILFATACTNSTNGQSESIQTENQTMAYKNMSAREVSEMLATRNEAVVVLDVRTPEEWAEGQLEGAMELNFYDEFEQRVEALDKEKTYVVYCKLGGRSAQASQMMADKGFANVINMKGGYDGWKDAGLKTTK